MLQAATIIGHCHHVCNQSDGASATLGTGLSFFTDHSHDPLSSYPACTGAIKRVHPQSLGPVIGVCGGFLCQIHDALNDIVYSYDGSHRSRLPAGKRPGPFDEDMQPEDEDEKEQRRHTGAAAEAGLNPEQRASSGLPSKQQDAPCRSTRAEDPRSESAAPSRPSGVNNSESRQPGADQSQGCKPSRRPHEETSLLTRLVSAIQQVSSVHVHMWLMPSQ